MLHNNTKIGSIYKFKFGELYQLVHEVHDGEEPKVVIEQIGGTSHGLISADDPAEFHKRYELVSG